MAITVRRMRASDVAAIAGIERRITKSRRTSALQRNLRDHLDHGDPGSCLVAESEGAVVGFIVGDVRPWEFGEQSSVARIKIVGVDSRWQGRGVGTMLGDRLLAHFRRRRVAKVETFVEWDAGDLIAYFQALGFRRGSHLSLERTLR